MRTSNGTDKASTINLNSYFLFKYITEMGDVVKYCDGLISGYSVSFAKVHLSKSVTAIYAARTVMDSDLKECEDEDIDNQVSGELAVLYDQKEKRFRLFKNSLFFDLFSKTELPMILSAKVLAPLSFDDVVGMAFASGRGDMPNIFTQRLPDNGMGKYISDTIVDQIAYDNTYTVIDEELLLPAIIDELNKLKYCTFNLKRFSSRVDLEPSSSWEEEAARRWLISTLSPQFPCFNLHKNLSKYRQHIQRKIKELERQYFDDGVVEVKFYDVFRQKRVFHADDDLDNTEIELEGSWGAACDLDMCCVSPAERNFLKDLTYIKDGDKDKKIVPWSDIISITGKFGKRRFP